MTLFQYTINTISVTNKEYATRMQWRSIYMYENVNLIII